MVSLVIGGIGLFLLGMWLMSEGLKLAAGDTLHAILARWTSTPARGFLTGLGLTGLVQSSSAVSMATIGFANAELLTLGQAIWVIYGANVGTTFTGWIVQFLGLRVDVGLYAMPLVGLGTALRLTGGGGRRAAWGQALAGFGLLFLGIATLKSGFEELASTVALPDADGGSPADLLLYLAFGIVLTTLMQSSSAVLVVVMSALASGLVTLPLAAAMTLGAAVGTTLTAILAAVGATATAKRVASAHVIFACLAALIGFVLLRPLLGGITWALGVAGVVPEPTLVLVLFFTGIKLVGVAAIWPLTPALTRFLETRFTAGEGTAVRLQYLDHNVLQVPALALEAALRETARLRGLASAAIAAWLAEPAAAAPLARAADDVRGLADGIADFLAQLSGAPLTSEEVARLQLLLRTLQHYRAAVYDAQRAAGTIAESPAIPPERRELARAIAAAIDRPETMAKALERQLKDEREGLKARLLARAAAGRLSLEAMDAHLRGMNAELRMLRHLRKGHRYIEGFHETAAADHPAAEEEIAAEPAPV